MVSLHTGLQKPKFNGNNTSGAHSTTTDGAYEGQAVFPNDDLCGACPGTPPDDDYEKCGEAKHQ